jgi:hypothetical protein
VNGGFAVRLAFLMELVVALAVGLGFARDLGGGLRADPFLEPGFVTLGSNFVFAVLAGFGLVVGLDTWLEAARRRGPIPWGPGRWVWSVVAAYMVLKAASCLPVMMASTRAVILMWPVALPYPRNIRDVESVVLVDFDNTVPWLLGAVAFTRWVARSDRTAATDARERTGRAYAVLLVALAVAVKVLLAVGFDPGASYILIY